MGEGNKDESRVPDVGCATNAAGNRSGNIPPRFLLPKRLGSRASIIIAVLSIGIFSLLAHPAHIG